MPAKPKPLSSLTFQDKWGIRLVRLVVYLTVLGILFLIIDILYQGLPVLSLDFLIQSPTEGGSAGGIFPAIVGTLCLALGTLAIALPLGIGGAIYLAEYAPNSRVTRAIRLAIATLAGVPSIVFGLFGLGVFVMYLGFGTSILSGCFTLSCMILPTIIVTSEEALRSVPMGFREGSLALGVTKWETIYRNVLPYALPGMLTGSILGISRAAGETAPIMLTAAAFYLPTLPGSLWDSVMALPYHLYVLATQHPDVANSRPRAYATAAVLLFLVLTLNGVALWLRRRLRKRYRW